MTDMYCSNEITLLTIPAEWETLANTLTLSRPCTYLGSHNPTNPSTGNEL